MRVAKVLAVVLVVLLVEGVLWVTWLATGAMTERCNQGEDSWLCSTDVAQALVVALIAFPIAALLAAIAVLTTRRMRQRRDPH